MNYQNRYGVQGQNINQSSRKSILQQANIVNQMKNSPHKSQLMQELADINDKLILRAIEGQIDLSDSETRALI